MRFARVTSDDSGGSRFEETEVSQGERPYASNVPPLLVSEPISVTDVVFVTMGGVRETDWHPPPRRQLIVVTDGELEIKTTDGETRTFGPGNVALVEDVAGRGHMTTVISSNPATFMAIPLTT